jgi:hypothetical protein
MTCDDMTCDDICDDMTCDDMTTERMCSLCVSCKLGNYLSLLPCCLLPQSEP